MQQSRRSALRRRLNAGSALAGGLLLLLPASAYAQAELPHDGRVISGDATWSLDGAAPVNAGPINPTVTDNSGTLNVRLNTSSSVINWDSFSIGRLNGTSNGVAFVTNLGGNVAVLNRVTGATVSRIDGTLTAGNIAVWLINPNGILVGSNGVISAGQFVGSSLDIACSSVECDMAGDDLVLAQFSAASGDVALAERGGSTAGVMVSPGAQITAANGLALLGPSVDTRGILNSDGAIALVAAREVSMSRPHSPIQFTITRGTQVTGTVMNVGGDVKGGTVTVAASALADAMLNIDGSVSATTVSTVDGVVVLGGIDSTGTRISATATDAGGTVTVAGSQNAAISSRGDIRVEGNGNVRFDRSASLIAGGDSNSLSLAADADIYIRAENGGISLDEGSGAAGTVAAGGSIHAGREADGTLTAESFSGASRTLVAGGSVSVGASAGDVSIGTARAGVDVLIDALGTGNVDLGDAFAGGNVSLGSSARRVAGAARVTGDVTAGGAYSIYAASAELGNDAGTETQQAVGGIIVDTTGNIVGGVGLALIANNDLTGGEDLTLASSAGRIMFDRTASLRAGYTSDATFDAGSDLVLRTPLGGISLDDGSGAAGTVAAGGSIYAGRQADGTLTAKSFLGASRTLVALGSVSVGASAGDVSIGTARAGADVLIDALGTGNVDLGDAFAGGNVSLGSSAQRVAGTARITGNVTAGGAYTIYAASAELGNDANAETQQAVGGISVDTTGNIIGGAGLALIANSDLAGGEDLMLASSAGGILFDRTASLRAGYTSDTVFDADSDLALRTPLGGISLDVGSGTAGTVAAGGSIYAGREADGTLTAESFLGASRTLAALGSVNVGASAGDVSIGTARAGVDVLIDALGTGNVDLTDAVAGRHVSLGSSSRRVAGAARVTGNVTAGGAYSIYAASAELGNDAGTETQQAVGGVTVDTTGNIIGGIGLTLIANSDLAGGEDLTLTSSAGGILFDRTASLRAGYTSDATFDAASDLVLRTPLAGISLDGGSGAAGAVAAGGSIYAGREVDGTLTAKSFAGASRTLAALGSVNVGASAGDVSIGTARAGVDVLIDALGSGNVDLTDAFAGGNVSLGSSAQRVAGAVRVTGDVTAGGTYSIYAGSAELGHDAGTETQQAVGGIIVDTTGNIIGGVGLALIANSDLTGGEDLTLASSGGGILFDRTASLRAGYISDTQFDAGSDLALRTPLGGISLDGGSGAAGTVAAGGSVYAGREANGTLTARSFAGASRTLAALGSVNVGASAGDISIGTVRAGADVLIDALGSGNIDLTDALAGGNVSLGSSSRRVAGAARVTGNVTAGGAYSIYAASAELGNDAGAETQQAVGGITVDTTGNIIGGIGLALIANSDLTGGEHLTLASSGGGILFDRTASLRAGYTSDTQFDAGSDLALRAPLGGISLDEGSGAAGTVAAGGSIYAGREAAGTLTAKSFLGASRTLVALGSVNVGASAGDVSIGTARAGVDVLIDALGTGNVDLTDAFAGRHVEIAGSGIVSIRGDVGAGLGGVAGHYSVLGASVMLGDDGDTANAGEDDEQSALDTISIRSTTGDIWGGRRLKLAANATGNAAAITLDSAGAIRMGSPAIPTTLAALLPGGSQGAIDTEVARVLAEMGRLGPALTTSTLSGVQLRAAAGSSILLGTVTTGSLGSIGGVPGQLDHAGDFSAHKLDIAGGIWIHGQDLTINSAVSGGTIRLRADGRLSGVLLAPADADSVDYFKGLDLTGGAIDAAGASAIFGTVDSVSATLAATSGDLVASQVTGSGLVQLSAQGNLRIGVAWSSAGNLSATAADGDITGLALATDGSVPTGLASYGWALLSGADVVVSAGRGTGTGTSVAGAGTARLGAVTASGMLTVDAQAIVANDKLWAKGGDARLTAHHGDLSVTEVESGTANMAAPGGSVILRARIDAAAATPALGTGQIDAARLLADANVDLGADGTATVLGDVTAGRAGVVGNYQVDAASINLGTSGTAVTQQANGAVLITATGNIIGSAGLALIANNDLAGGEDLTLVSSGGGIMFDRTASLRAGYTSDATFDAGSDLALRTPLGGISLDVGSGAAGAVAAGGSIYAGRQADGTLTAKSFTGASRTLVAGGSVSVGASAGDVSIGTVRAGVDVLIDALGTGNVDLGDAVAGGNISLGSSARRVAGAARVTGNVTAGGAYSIYAASAELGNDAGSETQQAVGGIIVDTTGNIIGGAGLALIANNDLTGGEDLTLASSGGGILFDRTASLRAGYTSDATFDAGSDLALRTPLGGVSLDEGSGTAGAVAAGGSIYAGREADGTLTARRFTGASRTLAALGSVNVGASAGDVSIGTARAGVDVLIDALGTGNVDLTDAVAGRHVSLGSSSRRVAGAARVTGNVTAGGAYTIYAASAELGNDADAETQQAVGGVTVDTTGNIVGGAGLALIANNDLAGGEDLILASSGGGIMFDRTASLRAGYTSDTQFDAGSDLALRAPLGGISLDEGSGAAGTVAAGGSIYAGREAAGTLTAKSFLGASRTLVALGSVNVGASAGDVSIGTARAGVDVLIDALGSGNVDLTDAFAGRNVSLGSSSRRVAGAARVTGNVTAGGAYSIYAASAELGNDAGTETQQAAGGISVDTTGNIIGGIGLALIANNDLTGGEDLTLASSAGGIMFDRTASLRAGYTSDTQFDAGSDLALRTPLGGISLDEGSGTAGTVAAGGSIYAGREADGTLTAKSFLGASRTLVALGSVNVGASAGDVSIGTARAGVDVLIDALGSGNVDLTDAFAGRNVSLGSSARRVAGTARVTGNVTAGGAYSVFAASAELGNDAGAETQQAANGVTVDATGNIIGGAGLTLRSNSDGAGPDSSNALSLLSSSGNILFDSSSLIAGGTSAVGSPVTISAPDGYAVLGRVSAAGKTITLSAEDLDLLAAVDANKIVIVNTEEAAATRLGSVGTAAAAANGGIRLSNAELDRINAPQVVIGSNADESGIHARNVEIGQLALASLTGASRFSIYATTGSIAITGRFSASGAARTVQLGGNATGGGLANRLTITYGDSPGSIDVGEGTIDLRAERIVGGRATFINQVAGSSDVQADFVSNPNSSLYVSERNPGDFFAEPVVLVEAGRMIIRYSDYALFQNTAGLGRAPAGIHITGPSGGPGSQPLQLFSNGIGAGNDFAAFGSIVQGDHGVAGPQTALLGSLFIGMNDVDPNNSRLNGCLIGAASGGCLATSTLVPSFTVGDILRPQVLTTIDELQLTYDALMGSNNDALIGSAPREACPEGSDSPQCKK